MNQADIEYLGKLCDATVRREHPIAQTRGELYLRVMAALQPAEGLTGEDYIGLMHDIEQECKRRRGNYK